MFRKIVRILAALFFIGSVAIGGFATYVWLTPSDEQILYEKAHQESLDKLTRAQAARGTPAEAALAKEARASSDSANAWARGYRERLYWNRLGVIASWGTAFVSLTILVLTFLKRKNNSANANPASWPSQNPGLSYGGRPGFDDPRPPRS